MNGLASSSHSSSSASGTLQDEPPLYWIDSEGTAHERCNLLIFVGNTFLGQSPIDPGNCPELGYRRGSVAYFCPSCGEIWGRIVLVNSKGLQTAFAEIVRVACERHFDQWETAGSFLSGYRNENYLDYLPLAAVQREFLIRYRGVET